MKWRLFLFLNLLPFVVLANGQASRSKRDVGYAEGDENEERQVPEIRDRRTLGLGHVFPGRRLHNPFPRPILRPFNKMISSVKKIPNLPTTGLFIWIPRHILRLLQKMILPMMKNLDLPGLINGKCQHSDGNGNSVEQTTKKSAEETTEKSAEETTEKPAEETTEKPAEETTEKPAEETTENTAEETTEKSAEETTEKSSEETTEKSEEETSEKSAEETSEKSDEETTEKSAEETTEKPEGSEDSPDSAPDGENARYDPPPKKPVKRAIGKPAKKIMKKPQKNARKKPAEKTTKKTGNFPKGWSSNAF